MFLLCSDNKNIIYRFGKFVEKKKNNENLSTFFIDKLRERCNNNNIMLSPAIIERRLDFLFYFIVIVIIIIIFESLLADQAFFRPFNTTKYDFNNNKRGTRGEHTGELLGTYFWVVPLPSLYFPRPLAPHAPVTLSFTSRNTSIMTR